MRELPDFIINPGGKVSLEFLTRNISSFHQACTFVKYLPYGRNANKEDPATVFTDNCGTCSTKHALLKYLTDENNFREVKLMMGLYKMNSRNTPGVSATLKKHGLDYIPEAHNYLKYKDQVFDFTKVVAFDFMKDLLEETEILPEQIGDYKVIYHKNYLQTWLAQNSAIPYTLNELWEIREQCIRDLFTRNY
jgi:hypothetical protein